MFGPKVKDGRTDDAEWKLQRASAVASGGEEISSNEYDDADWLPAVVPGTVLYSYIRTATTLPSSRSKSVMSKCARLKAPAMFPSLLPLR